MPLLHPVAVSKPAVFFMHPSFDRQRALGTPKVARRREPARVQAHPVLPTTDGQAVLPRLPPGDPPGQRLRAGGNVPPLAAAPPAVASVAQDALAVQRMAWTLARLPLARPALTLAVALGKLASEAGATYTSIIGAKLLVSRRLRFEDAVLTIGLTMVGNLLQLLEARWEIATEKHFQTTILPWMAQHRARHLPHDAAAYEALGKLTLERSTRWVDAAGLVGRLGSSVYGAIGHAHHIPRALMGMLVGFAALRHGLGAWWAQHIQQRSTDWSLERTRATFALLRSAGTGAALEAHANAQRLEHNRASRLHLRYAGIGVESVQEMLLLAACYGAFWRLGWFAPGASLETLVAAQAAMTAARALVTAMLTIPLFAVQEVQMHNHVATWLRAQPE